MPSGLLFWKPLLDSSLRKRMRRGWCWPPAAASSPSQVPGRPGRPTVPKQPPRRQSSDPEAEHARGARKTTREGTPAEPRHSTALEGESRRLLEAKVLLCMCDARVWCVHDVCVWYVGVHCALCVFLFCVYGVCMGYMWLVCVMPGDVHFVCGWCVMCVCCVCSACCIV